MFYNQAYTQHINHGFLLTTFTSSIFSFSLDQEITNRFPLFSFSIVLLQGNLRFDRLTFWFIMPLPQLQLWPTGKDRHKMWNCFRNGCRRVYCCKCAVRNHVKSSYIRLQQVRGRRAAKLNHRAFSFNRFAVAAFAVHSIFTAVNTFSYIFILLSNIFHVRSLLGTRKLVRFAWQYSR